MFIMKQIRLLIAINILFLFSCQDDNKRGNMEYINNYFPLSDYYPNELDTSKVGNLLFENTGSVTIA